MKLFTAPWCSSCKPIKTLIESKSIPIELIDIDTDEGSNLANRYNIRSLPTLVDAEGVILSSSNLSIIKILKETFKV